MTAVTLGTCRICHELDPQEIRQHIFFHIPNTEFNLLSSFGDPSDSRVKWQKTSTQAHRQTDRQTGNTVPRCIHYAKLARSIARLWHGC